MIWETVVTAIMIALWLGNSDVERKENAKTTLCVGVCMTTEADLAEGNTHDENDPSVLKVINDTIPAIGPQQEK